LENGLFYCLLVVQGSGHLSNVTEGLCSREKSIVWFVFEPRLALVRLLLALVEAYHSLGTFLGVLLGH